MKNNKALSTIIAVITVTTLLGAGLFVYLSLRKGNSTNEESGTNANLAFGVLRAPVTPEGSVTATLSMSGTISAPEYTQKVYKVNHSDTFYPSESLANNVSQILSMKRDYADSQIISYINKQTGPSLIYNKNYAMITLYLENTGNSQKRKKRNVPTQSQAKIIAQDKLKLVKLWPYNEEPKTFYTYYISDSDGYEYYRIDNESKANLMSVNFAGLVEGIPKQSDYLSSGEIEVFLDRSSQVSKIIYTYRPIYTDTVATYPLKSINLAFLVLKDGKGEMLSSYPLETPKSITFTTVQTAYRVEHSDQQYLQPVYIFEGKGTSGQLITAVVPAIDDRYLTYPTKTEASGD